MKSYGEGLNVSVKTETKGKTVSEGKAILAYDKNSDKYIQTRIMNDKGALNSCNVVHLKKYLRSSSLMIWLILKMPR